jgi:hypothetical protein
MTANIGGTSMTGNEQHAPATAREGRSVAEGRRETRDFQGHLCVQVPWFLTTDIMGGPNGDVRVSTVGEYVDPFRSGLTTIGYKRTYETMVFPLGEALCECGCGARKVSNWSEQDFSGYNDRESAIAGHEAMCAKWERLIPAEAQS